MWAVIVVVAAAAMVLVSPPEADAQVTEVCNAGVSCSAGMCTASITPVSMLSVQHFFGIQSTYPYNTQAVNCQAGSTMGLTCTMTGSPMCDGYGGTNTTSFPVVVMATRSTMATAPSCAFVMKINSGYVETGICTISAADGLPVELLEFEVGDDESDESKPGILSKKKRSDEE